MLPESFARAVAHKFLGPEKPASLTEWLFPLDSPAITERASTVSIASTGAIRFYCHSGIAAYFCNQFASPSDSLIRVIDPLNTAVILAASSPVHSDSQQTTDLSDSQSDVMNQTETEYASIYHDHRIFEISAASSGAFTSLRNRLASVVVARRPSLARGTQRRRSSNRVLNQSKLKRSFDGVNIHPPFLE